MSIHAESDGDVVAAQVRRRRCCVDTGSETEVEQSHKDECDVNVILSRYQRSGMIDHLNKREPKYVDVTDISQCDFQCAMDIVARGQSAFNSLPAEERKRYNNDIGKYLDDIDRKHAQYMQEQERIREREKLKEPPVKPDEKVDGQ